MNETTRVDGKITLSTEIQNLDMVVWRISNLLFSPDPTPKEPSNIPTGEISLAMYMVQEITKRLENIEIELKNLK